MGIDVKWMEWARELFLTFCPILGRSAGHASRAPPPTRCAQSVPRHARKQGTTAPTHRLSHLFPPPTCPPPPQEGTPRRHSDHLSSLSDDGSGHGDLTDLGAAAASGAAGGPVGAGVLARLRHRHAQAARGHGGGRHGRGAQFHAAPGHRGRDALRHRPLFPPALHHRLRPPVHLHPEELALDPPRLPLHGHRRRLHGGAASPARPPRRVHRRRVHPGRYRRHHVLARRAQRVRVHAPVHHPRRRHDGRQRHDRHRRHHEEAPRGRQVPEEPRRDGARSGCDTEAGDGGAGEEVAGDRAVAGDRQRQDGGADRAAGGHDRAHHGGSVAAGGDPAADRGDEHAHGGVHRQQHPLHLPLLAGLLHQGIPARRLCICRLVKSVSSSTFRSCDSVDQ